MAFKMFLKLSAFHDNETRLLLAAPVYFQRKMGIEEAPYGICCHLGKKLLLPELFDVMLYELDM